MSVSWENERGTILLDTVHAPVGNLLNVRWWTDGDGLAVLNGIPLHGTLYQVIGTNPAAVNLYLYDQWGVDLFAEAGVQAAPAGGFQEHLSYGLFPVTGGNRGDRYWSTTGPHQLYVEGPANANGALAIVYGDFRRRIEHAVGLRNVVVQGTTDSSGELVERIELDGILERVTATVYGDRQPPGNFAFELLDSLGVDILDGRGGDINRTGTTTFPCFNERATVRTYQDTLVAGEYYTRFTNAGTGTTLQVICQLLQLGPEAVPRVP